MFECRDNQEVGLEAATLERVRNSSLVKCSGAENVTGLKPASEAVGSSRLRAADREESVPVRREAVA